MQIFYEEILKRSPRRELLNEYACHLVKYHPHLKHDVLSKLNFLNKQWRSMEFSIISKRYFNEDIARDLQEDMKNFEIWLQKVESIVENLCIKPDWTVIEIERNLNEHKVRKQSRPMTPTHPMGPLNTYYFSSFHNSVYKLILNHTPVLSIRY